MAVKAFEILKDWLQSLEPGTKLSRRAWLEKKYTAPDEKEAKDISEDISKYFLSVLTIIYLFIVILYIY